MPFASGNLEHTIGRLPVRLHHAQIEGKLHEPKVMVGAAGFCGECGDGGQVQLARLAEAIPSGRAIVANPACRDKLLPGA